MTNTTNVSQAEEEDGLPLSAVIPAGIVISIFIILAVVGNIMTILAFIRDRRLRTVYNFYIVNLAVTDCLLGCISMPFYASYTLDGYTWWFGYHFCKVFMTIDFTLCLETVIMMICLSWDRLMLLKTGSRYNQTQTPKSVCIKILISWVIASLLYGPAIIGWDLWTGEDISEENDCNVQFAYDVAYTTTTAMLEFTVPLICISVLNFLVYWEIRKRILSRGTSVNKTVASNTTSTNSQNRSSFMTSESNQHPVPQLLGQTETSQQRIRRDIKAAKCLAVLIAMFAITWAPYTVGTVIFAFCESCINVHLYEFTNWLLWMKAAINPFLYAFNSERFKKNFKQLCSCRLSRNAVTETNRVAALPRVDDTATSLE